MKIDIHAHLDCKEFDKDIDEVIKNAEKADVRKIINNGLNVQSNRATLILSEKYEIVQPAYGLYPIDALKLTDTEIDNEIQFIKEHTPIAVGEIGLDYHWDKKDHERQKEIFIKMVKLAKHLKVPMIIHSREAEEDVINILEDEHAKKVILHCFNGDKRLIKRAIDLKYYFSIPCIITFAKQFQELVKTVNINQLLTETDCPLMSPFRGKRNEPANVNETIKKIAELKGFDPKETENNIQMNFMRLFD